MATSHTRSRIKDINNTGFGPNSNVEGGRLINPDGTTNLKKRGLPVWERTSIYHTLLRMQRTWFFFAIFLFYTGLNIFFAFVYFFIGVEHLAGLEGTASVITKFVEAFFFSSQTLTTVGYGRVAPTGFLTNCVASLESFLGILIFAIVTGLIYGRFSRPRAYLMFSGNILVAPYKNGKAIMLRMCTYKNNHITDAEANLTLALHVTENGKVVTRFFPLQLEISKVNTLSLSWTLVHAITEDSPLYAYTKEQVNESKLEVIVNVKAFDDHFSNVVQQRTSYTYKQVVYGARFLPMFERSEDGTFTLLQLDRINSHVPADLPVTETV